LVVLGNRDVRPDGRRLRIVMALENNAYPADVRVRAEAEELVREGHAVIVVAPRRPGEARREHVAGVEIRRFWVREASGVAGLLAEYATALPQLWAGITRELLRGADVVHLHNPPDLLFPAAWIARALGRSVVFDHHDLSPELFEAKFGGGWMVRTLRACERLTMNAATLVLAANESHRRVAIERGAVDPRRIFLVRNGPARDTLVDGPSARKGAIRDPRLCYVGTLGAQDGVELLPAVLQRLLRDGYQPSLLLVGDGPHRDKVLAVAEQLEVEHLIAFTGSVPHERVPELISRADICLDVAPGTRLNHCSTMIKIG
jgi:glycosyltransferase involved in cell wall biosynthesis